MNHDAIGTFFISLAVDERETVKPAHIISSDITPAQPRRLRMSLLDSGDKPSAWISAWIIEIAPDIDLLLDGSSMAEFEQSTASPGDVILIDYQLDQASSIEHRVRTCRAAGTKVIVMSGVVTRETRERSLNAGAIAFVSKEMTVTALMDVARDAMGVDDGLFTPLPAAVAPEHRVRVGIVVPKLSAGETEALRLYVTGLTVAGVADDMDVHFETAKTYIRRVREKYTKLGRCAGRRADLIRRAAEDGRAA